MKRVDGKVALVTGAAGGIGQAIARRLGQEGARLVVSDLDPQAGAAVAGTLTREGLDATFVAHDVADEASWAAATRAAQQAYGRLDILVNNAGTGSMAPRGIEEVSFEEWRRVMRVNLDGVFLGMKAAVLAMKDSGGGAIVNIGSVAGYIGTRGGPAYGTSKGALRTLTRQVATSCARNGYRIRVNCIHPCYVWSSMSEKIAASLAPGGNDRETLANLHPFKRVGEPDDVAWGVVYLASDEANLITGTDLVMDGGLLAT